MADEVTEEMKQLQRPQIPESNEVEHVNLEKEKENEVEAAGGGDCELSDSPLDGCGKENKKVIANDCKPGSSTSDHFVKEHGDQLVPEREDPRVALRRLIQSGSDDTGHSSSDEPERSGSPLSTSSSRETLDCTELFLAAMLKKTNIYSTDAIPLNNPWTFWVERSRRGVAVEEFEANLKRIYTVYTVHLFWGVFYNIPLPSTLHVRSSLHMTRDERKPVWEESYNRGGGTFRMRVNKRDTDKVWRELLMAAVGEQLNEYVGPNDEICGVSVSAREREDVVLIWNTNAKSEQQARVFECVHMLLPDTAFISEFYKPHCSHLSYDKHKDIHAHGSKSSNFIASGGH